MKKILKALALAVILLAIPVLSFGQSISDAFNNTNIVGSFTPAASDLSVNYLGQIFGTVGTVLHGTSGQFLGQIFKIFNIGLLVVAGIVLIYTIIMTVIHTSHEGEFMGRKWNSAWIAIRTVLGLGLLVPSATTGYSAIQVFVMWIVLQGVGFANMAWNSGLNYLLQGNVLYTPPTENVGSVINLAGTVMEMQACMYTAQHVEQTLQQNLQKAQGQQGTSTNTADPNISGQNYVQNFKPLFTIIQGPDGKWSSMVKFPGNKYSEDGAQDNACGQIAFGSGVTKNFVSNDPKTTILKAAIQQMMLDTDSYAQQMVDSQLPRPSGSPGPTNPNLNDQVQSAIVGASADWINVTMPIRSSTQGNNVDQGFKKVAEVAQANGWIMAGRYYRDLGNVQRDLTDAARTTVDIDSKPAGFQTADKYYLDFRGYALVSQTSNMKSLLDFTDPDKDQLVMIQNRVIDNVQNAITVGQQVDNSEKFTLDKGGDANILTRVYRLIFPALDTTLQEFNQSTGDPIVVLQNIGWNFFLQGFTIWLGSTATIFSLGIGLSGASLFNPAPFALIDATFAIIPVIVAFTGTLFTLGMLFHYYVPLIPFIIYTFAGLGWLIAVIEAMIAAPLVALGITHPEGGHDLLGKGEQAVMLLLGVFLRPILMVFGLIAAIIVSRVSLRYFNMGFFGFALSNPTLNPFATLGLLIVYAMLLIAIVNQTFSLIYVIPDKIMRWLGLSPEQSGVQEALQLSKQGFEQMTSAQERLQSGTSSAVGSSATRALPGKKPKKDPSPGGVDAKPG
jgi:defect in organelle trafficking protein DotA